MYINEKIILKKQFKITTPNAYALTYMNELQLPILFFKFLIWNLSESQECRKLHFNEGMLKEYMTVDYKDKINGRKYWWQEGLIMEC